MKIPNELGLFYVEDMPDGLGFVFPASAVEAIIRHCAKVCEDLHGGPEDYAIAILAEFGLPHAR